ncbi:ethanolamine ammonia-lyase subunit EutC [Acidicapsa dinghuensis]|uniref:Ethanolamine ammonia-lyase small subunit n=1 Tax=Acidicapsa dinghuensis TaxID=2218256 RepID=A0ABW1EDE3_9BACT|nr:ethanolamine ammonia-lyase subunit EutC [Acidicapsa dinghuensis]
MTKFVDNSSKTEFASLEKQKAAEDAPALSSAFRSFTPARIGLHKTGVSIATQECLAFQFAHARARDAVHAELQVPGLMQALQSILTVQSLPEPAILLLHSTAPDRQTYLQRPDMGRKLDISSLQRLVEIHRADKPFGLSIVIADGLSALAVERNSAALLTELFPLLYRTLPSLRVAPLCVVQQGRVAIGDEVARALSAELVIVLIGERPGLSSPDSLGVYITWLHPGKEEEIPASSEHTPAQIADADRNCISNIRSEGLCHAEAASRILYYIQEARLRKQTGTALKDPEPGHRYLGTAEST